MINKINERLNQYLEFDNNELYVNNLIRIFGGAIRDSISGDPINDIDILCGANSVPMLESVLEKHGYIYMNKISTKDIMSMYSDINVISEPRTWMKDSKIIQVIRPRHTSQSLLDIKNNPEYYEMNFKNLIANVDISCCGLSYAKGVLYENYENAIAHAANKKFYVNKYAYMYSQKRAINRTYKLENRGWEIIEDEDLFIKNRDMRIDNVINNVVYEYKREYELSEKLYNQNK